MLEEQLVHLFVTAMTEEDGAYDDSEALWRNLSSELIFSVLFQYITFPTFVSSVTEKLKKLKEVLTLKTPHVIDFLTCISRISVSESPCKGARFPAEPREHDVDAAAIRLGLHLQEHHGRLRVRARPHRAPLQG